MAITPAIATAFADAVEALISSLTTPSEVGVIGEVVELYQSALGDHMASITGAPRPELAASLQDEITTAFARARTKMGVP